MNNCQRTLFSLARVTSWKKRLIEWTNYSPYGDKVVSTRWKGSGYKESQYGINLGFTGRYLDSETDLYYFRARYYDTDQGRFISRDPAGYVDGMGLYNGYFASRFMMDPSGKIMNPPPVCTLIGTETGLIAEATSRFTADCGNSVDMTVSLSVTSGIFSASHSITGTCNAPANKDRVCEFYLRYTYTRKTYSCVYTSGVTGTERRLSNYTYQTAGIRTISNVDACCCD